MARRITTGPPGFLTLVASLDSGDYFQRRTESLGFLEGESQNSGFYLRNWLFGSNLAQLGSFKSL